MILLSFQRAVKAETVDKLTANNGPVILAIAHTVNDSVPETGSTDGQLQDTSDLPESEFLVSEKKSIIQLGKQVAFHFGAC